MAPPKAFSDHGARSASRTGRIEKDKIQKWAKKSQKQRRFGKAMARNAMLVVAFVTAVACFWVYVGVTMGERGSNVVLQSSLATTVFVIYGAIVVSGVIPRVISDYHCTVSTAQPLYTRFPIIFSTFFLK